MARTKKNTKTPTENQLKGSELDVDMAVLSHARTFGLGVWGKGSDSGGVCLSVGTVSERREREAAERLLALGYVTKQETDSIMDGRRLVRYEVTDAGREAIRKHYRIPDLTLEEARLMHPRDLREGYGDLPLAQRQLELREFGGRLVRGVLAGLGYVYTGTSGWWVTAFVTPTRHVGFVNTAKGIAVQTSCQLEADVVEALTIPEQREGPIVSGAVAWAECDPGESKLASAPEGWLQLVMDLRKAAGDAPVESTARVIRWGLATCYDSARGLPGYTSLDPIVDERRVPFDQWPIDEETRRAIKDMAYAWLRSLVLRLGAELGIEGELTAALDGPGHQRADANSVALRIPSRRGQYYSGPSALESAACYVTSKIVPEAMSAAKITRLCVYAQEFGLMEMVGGRYYDLAEKLIDALVVKRLEATAIALEASVAALLPSPTPEVSHELTVQRYRVLEALMPGVVKTYTTELLKPYEEEACGAEDRIIERYYANGAVVVDVPHTNPTPKAA